MISSRFNKRQIFLGVLCLLTVLAAVWPLDEDKQPEKYNSHVSARHKTHPKNMTVRFKPMNSMDVSDDVTPIPVDNLFPQQTWTPPPLPVEQSAPVAPPLPFTYAGRYIDAEQTTVFLTEGNQLHRVKQGESINSLYRIEKIDASSVTLTYLPLGTSQILPAGVSLP